MDYLTAAIFAAYLPLLLHELSHAIVMSWLGGKITAFKPYPHFYGEKLWFGRVQVLWAYGRPDAYRFSHIAPVVKTLLFAGIWASLALAIDTPPLFLLAAGELVDLLWWFACYRRPGSDAHRWFNR